MISSFSFVRRRRSIEPEMDSVLYGYFEAGLDLTVVLEVSAVVPHVVGCHLGGPVAATLVPARAILRVRTGGHVLQMEVVPREFRCLRRCRRGVGRLLVEPAYRGVHGPVRIQTSR